MSKTRNLPKFVREEGLGDRTIHLIDTKFPDVVSVIEAVNPDNRKNIVIAGGSIVWSIMKTSSKVVLVGDLDVFILNKDKGALQQIIQVFNDMINRNDKYGIEDSFWITYGNMITLHREGKLPIQFIITSHDTVEDLLMSFDFDYVQTAFCFSNRELVSSEWAMEAHKTKIISYIRDSSYQMSRLETRCQKAIDKGFRFPSSIRNIGHFGVYLTIPAGSDDIYEFEDFKDYEPQNGAEYSFQYAQETRANNSDQVIETTATLSRIKNWIYSTKPHRGMPYELGGPIDLTEPPSYFCLDNEIDNDELDNLPVKIPVEKEKEVEKKKEVNEKVIPIRYSFYPLYEMFNNQNLSDFIVVIRNVNKKETVFYCHKIILNQISYFKSLFSANTTEKQNNKVVMDMDNKDFEVILRYCYCWDIDEALKCISILKIEASTMINIIRAALYLVHDNIIESLWEKFHDCIRKQESVLAIDELLTVLKIAKDYHFAVPECLKIHNIVKEETLTADDLMVLLPRPNRANGINIYHDWIINHPKDVEGHKKILESLDILYLSRAEMKIFFNKRVDTVPYTNFLLSYSMAALFEEKDIEDKVFVQNTKLKAKGKQKIKKYSDDSE